MKIAKNTVPSVTYTLTVNEEVVDSSDASNPLVFLFGAGAMIPGFEKGLEGLESGSNYDITVAPQDGYGDINPEAIVELPKDIFKVDGKVNEELLTIGNVIPMQDNQGQVMRGIVLEVAEEVVKMDFNHQLAGETLHFKGEVIDVREATADEIDHGHVHGPGGHHH